MCRAARAAQGPECPSRLGEAPMDSILGPRESHSAKRCAPGPPTSASAVAFLAPPEAPPRPFLPHLPAGRARRRQQSESLTSQAVALQSCSCRHSEVTSEPPWTFPDQGPSSEGGGCGPAPRWPCAPSILPTAPAGRRKKARRAAGRNRGGARLATGEPPPPLPGP